MSFKINRFDHITLDYNINVKSLTGIGVCFFSRCFVVYVHRVVCAAKFHSHLQLCLRLAGIYGFFAVVLLVSFRAVGTAMTLTAAARRKS